MDAPVQSLSHGQARAVVTQLRLQKSTLVEALERIRDMDYRGHPHYSATIAEKALEKVTP